MIGEIAARATLTGRSRERPAGDDGHVRDRATVLMGVMPDADYAGVIAALAGRPRAGAWPRPHEVPTGKVLGTWRGD